MPLDEGSIPIPAPNEVFVDRNRYITAKWYPFMVRLFKSLRTTINALDTVTETVDQVKGTWTLSINNNDRVVGYVKLDGSDVSTVFAVLADKFMIVNPAANNQEIQAFVQGMVNGVPTVGINGNLVVDDTILARHISVNSLSALSTNFGSGTYSGELRSAPGSVGNMVLTFSGNVGIRIQN